MVRRQSEQAKKERPQMYGGQGTVEMRSLLSGPGEMGEKGRLFAQLTIPVGGSIGFHVHEGESETFYILRGAGEFDDNGEKHSAGPGDVLLTAAGAGHALRNTGEEPLELVALILYE